MVTPVAVDEQINAARWLVEQMPRNNRCRQAYHDTVERLLDEGFTQDRAIIETLNEILIDFPEELLLVLSSSPPMDALTQRVCMDVVRYVRSEREKRDKDRMRIIELEAEVAALRSEINR
jgi:hypothetical protein